jgi:hypothetical protein
MTCITALGRNIALGRGEREMVDREVAAAKAVKGVLPVFLFLEFDFATMYSLLPATIFFFLPTIHATTTLINLTPLLSHHTPWSHDPYCTTSKSLTHRGQIFCVYTSNTTGPYGLSLILPPSAALAATHHLNANPVSNFLTQAQARDLYLHPPPWRVVEIEGKDKGVIATRRIEKYETFMIDQAAVVVDKTFDEAVSRKVKREMLKLVVNRLYTPGTILSMSRAHAGSSSNEPPEEAIMSANAFGSHIGDIATRALYPLISRINHACNPNSFVMFSQSGTSMAIKSYRAIAAGEEITISYLLLGAPSGKRQKILNEHWGFTCTCALCELSMLEKKASDVRRLLIAQAETKVLELARKGEIEQAIALAEESGGMIQDEGMESMLTDEYAMLAMLYLEKGDRETAKVWGRKAWRVLGDLGYLGVGDDEWVGNFSLEVLFEGIGGLGGDGQGKWRRSGS